MTRSFSRVFFSLLLLAPGLLRAESAAEKFYKAIANGDEATVRTTLDKGFNLNKTRIRGIPALTVAVQQDQVTIAKLLLEKGADPNAVDSGGRTALMWSWLDAKMSSAMTGTNRSGGLMIPETTTTYRVNERKSAAMFELLIERGANVNLATKDGLTALQLAAGLGFKIAVAALLAKGANPNLSDPDGQTPLIAAVASCDGNVLRDLMGRFPNGTVPDGAPTLYPDFAAVVSQLLANGANVSAATKKGATASAIATKSQLCKGLTALLSGTTGN